MLLLEQPASDFLERPAITLAGSEPESLVGSQVSHYRVVEQMVAAGWALCTRPKTASPRRWLLSSSLTSSHLIRRMSRFAREAGRVGLNHRTSAPHDIATRTGVVIVMEYLEGTTLRIGLPPAARLNALVDVGTQIADALDAAHTTASSIATSSPRTSSSDRAVTSRSSISVLPRCERRSPMTDTTRAGVTEGIVVGTAAYMAPEPARGEAVAHRAGIWSCGLVLYEMVKGTRPAPAVRLRVEESSELERIISKCLETDRERRYQHASELWTDLARLKSGTGAAMVPHPALTRRRALWFALGTAASSPSWSRERSMAVVPRR